MPKIGFIAPFGTACKQMTELAAAENVDIVCAVGIGKKAVPEVERMVREEEVGAVIAFYPTAKYLRPAFGDMIVEMAFPNYALVKLISKARTHGRKIAYLSIRGGTNRIEKQLLEEMLNVELYLYEMSEDDDRKKIVQRVIADGCGSLISNGKGIIRTCEEYLFPAYLLMPEDDISLLALRSAVLVASARNQKEEIQRFIDSEEEGILLIDSRNRIRSYNNILCEIAGISGRRKLTGQSIDELAKGNGLFWYLSNGQNAFRINGKEYIVTRFTNTVNRENVVAIKVIPIRKDLPYASPIQVGKGKKGGFTAETHLENIISSSQVMTDVKIRAMQFAKASSPVLIVGESGTGKELFAQSIHNMSAFSNGPFIAVNCASLPSDLIESELYGYEDGAFTGARRGGKVGLFELSQGGTLFLDEIGELPLEHQGRLLRSIQEKQIIRVGGGRPIRINNRIICATNRDLRKDIQDGNFRMDLYYRINVLNLLIPPLRERRGDIGELIAYYERTFVKEGSGAPKFSINAVRAIKEYSWPGNVRELFNFLESVIVTSGSGPVNEEHFMSMFRTLVEQEKGLYASGEKPRQTDSYEQEHKLTEQESEEKYIRKVYEECGYSTQEASRRLGISRTTLWRKLKKGRT